MELKRVVITGVGALTPIGNNREEYWSSLEKGTNGAGPITRFDPEKFRTKFACEIKNFDILDHLNRKEVKKMDPNTQFGMVVGEEAVKDCGINLESLDKDSVGVIWGSGIGGLKTFQEEAIAYGLGDGTPRFNPFFIPKMIIDITPGSTLH